MSRSEGTDQRIILTQFGRVALPLRRQRCQGCQRRFRPADECLKSLQGGNVTAALREACSETGASFPYVTAAQVVNDLCGAQISPEHVRRLTNRTGSQEAVCQAAGGPVATGSPEAARATSDVAGQAGWRLDQEPGVNPRIVGKKLIQVSGWASGLKRHTFGRERPAELYEFLPHNPGIYNMVGKHTSLASIIADLTGTYWHFAIGHNLALVKRSLSIL